MTREDLINKLKEAMSKVDEFVERVNNTPDINPLDSSMYIGNASSYKESCLRNIKLYSKMDNDAFSKLNLTRIVRDIDMRIKSLGLSCDALTSDDRPYTPMDPNRKGPRVNTAVKRKLTCKSKKYLANNNSEQEVGPQPGEY